VCATHILRGKNLYLYADFVSLNKIFQYFYRFLNDIHVFIIGSGNFTDCEYDNEGGNVISLSQFASPRSPGNIYNSAINTQNSLSSFEIVNEKHIVVKVCSAGN